jgi:RNA recognition motif-containing protein
MSVRLYVGNLPKEEVDRAELQAVFGDAGDSISTKVIKDRKTGQCRGFAFVTVKTDEQADELIEKFNGFVFKDSALKIEKALPRAKGAEEETPRPAAPVTAGTPSSTGGSTEKPSTGGGRRGNKKPRRGPSSSTPVDQEGIQPDPRWASELSKLKELLAAQASNS